MSDTQITQIMKELKSQSEVLLSIREEQKDVKRELQEYKEKLEPIHLVFESVSGFNSIAVWILKGLILLGAGVAVVYGLVQYLKR